MGWRTISARMPWPLATFSRWSSQGAARHIVYRALGDRLARWGDFLPGHGTILCALVPGLRVAGHVCAAASLVWRADAALAAHRGDAHDDCDYPRRRFAARLA